MLKGKTKSGFKYEISDESLNDYELVELLSEVDENPLLLPKLIKALLGEEQKHNLIEHIRTESGGVPMDALADEVAEIFREGRQTKNS